MKRIYDFSRKPAHRNYTVYDLKALKGSPKKLTMTNPANTDEAKACVEAGIDLFVLGNIEIEDFREVAPTHFMGAASIFAHLWTSKPTSTDFGMSHQLTACSRRSSRDVAVETTRQSWSLEAPLNTME